MIAIVCHGATTCERRSQYTNESYVRAVMNAGGSSILVPAIKDAVDIKAISQICDGLILTGSSSMVSPSRYGENHDEPNQDLERDAVSFSLAEAMIARGRPVLGICLGMQELNVLYGGSLQHLGNHGMHMRDADWKDSTIFDHIHEVEIISARFGEMENKRQSVISAHRQGIYRIGQGLNIAAVAEDGLIEAITADPEGRVVGVQWHAEQFKALIDKALFQNLLELA